MGTHTRAVPYRGGTSPYPDSFYTDVDYLEQALGWESVYVYNREDFGPGSLAGRTSDREVMLDRPLREKLPELNPGLPDSEYEAVRQIAAISASQTLRRHQP